MVRDTEIATLVSKTYFKSAYENQRTNLLLMSFALGQRSQSMIDLNIGNFQIKQDENGTEILVVRFGPMKNA